MKIVGDEQQPVVEDEGGYVEVVPVTDSVTMSARIDLLAAAIARAQGEMKHPELDKRNPHFGSMFASMPAVIDSVRPCLSKHGVAVMQFVGRDADHATLTTMFAHESGQWIGSTVSAPVTGGQKTSDIQSFGIVVTYLRRYTLQSVAVVHGDEVADNDGNDGPSGSGAAAKPKASQSARPRITKDEL